MKGRGMLKGREMRDGSEKANMSEIEQCICMKMS